MSQVPKKEKKVTKSPGTKKTTDGKFLFLSNERANELCEIMCCCECQGRNVECKLIRHQIDVSLKYNCKDCHCVLFSNDKDNVCSNGKFHVKTMSVVYLMMMMLGHSYSAIDSYCAYVSVPSFTKKIFMNYAKEISKCAKEHAGELLQVSREGVFDFYEKCLDRSPDAGGVLDIDVTLDGSWQTRGHKSNYCFGAVIDAQSGLVTDYITVYYRVKGGLM